MVPVFRYEFRGIHIWYLMTSSLDSFGKAINSSWQIDTRHGFDSRKRFVAIVTGSKRGAFYRSRVKLG